MVSVIKSDLVYLYKQILFLCCVGKIKYDCTYVNYYVINIWVFLFLFFQRGSDELNMYGSSPSSMTGGLNS